MKFLKLKKAMIFKICMNLSIFLLMPFILHAQKNYNVDLSSNYKINGTSSLHNWEMSGNGGTGTANFTVETNKVVAISSISVQINPEILKSGKSGMDKVAYKALNTTTYKTIKFVLKSAKKINTDTWELSGNLTIAAITKNQTFQVKSLVSATGIKLSGSTSFKLTDFGIKPPVALLGTVKTGDSVTISFNVLFK